MRPGTPGFIGARLREAREARGITAVSLAELARVTPQAISNYEHGRNSPNPASLHAMAAALRLPEAFFVQAVRPERSRVTFFRSLSAATKGARIRAEWRLEWLRDIARYVSRFVSFPDANFPDLRLPEDPTLISVSDIEQAAWQVRQYWNMHDGAIGNVVALIENQGGILARDELGAESLDSLCEFVPEDGRPYIIIGTDRGTPVRWRFDAAHELGHILIHGKLNRRQVFKPETFKLVEEQAHRFAGAFLLPTSSFAEDVFAISLDALRAIKPKWQTSIGTMIRRLRHLKLINEETERKLWVNYSRRGWRRHEPIDDQIEVEHPRTLSRAVELVLEESLQTPADISTAIGLPVSDVERICGLPDGFLQRDFSPVRLSDRHQSDETLDEGQHADILPLPFKPRTD